jgi:hypothetical protein
MLIDSPARASRRPAGGRPLAIFYRFTVEEAIETGHRAHAALDPTARGVNDEDRVVDCAQVEPQHRAPLRPLGFVLRVTT